MQRLHKAGQGGGLVFPVVNGVALAALWGVVGYYTGGRLLWLMLGALVGAGLAWGIDALLGRWRGRWLYKRRVLLVVVLEILISLYGVGPYMYVDGVLRSNNRTPCCVTPADYGVDYHAVSIPTEDGITLAGWVIPPPDGNPNAITIIVAHGMGGNRMGSLAHGKVLWEAGYRVLVYDQRGLGESSGHPSVGLLDAADVPYLIDYLVQTEGANPQRIGGVGLSLGANILLGAAVDEPRLHALWLDGMGPSVIDDAPPPRSAGDWVLASLDVAVDWWLGQRVGQDRPLITDQLAQMAGRPVQLVAGADEGFEVRANERFMEAAPPSVALWVVPDALHVGGLSVDPDGYTARMVAFFETNLAVEE